MLKLLYKYLKLSSHYKLSREEMKKLREEKFRDILKHSYQNSDFYHQYYNDHGIKEKDLDSISIKDIPVINKKIYVENFDDLTTEQELKTKKIEEFLDENDDRREKFFGKYTIVHTSGSTGEPTFFVYDKEAWATILAAGFRAAKGDLSLLKLLKSLRVAYIAATEGRLGGVMAAQSGIEGFGFSSLLLNINNPIDKWIDELKDFNPNVILGYPSGIKTLCDLINNDKLSLDIDRLLTAGEPLPTQLRNYLEKTLDTEVFNLYGASESIIMGLERNKYNGLYLFDDINYIEVEDKCTYVTPLYNYSQPLIRYELTDKLADKERQEKEELPFSKIDKIVGRNEEIMWFENNKGNEDFLHPFVLDDIEIEEMKRYQFVQKSDQEFEVRIILKDNVDSDDIKRKVKKEINPILEEKNMGNLKYRIKRVDELPVDPNTGKSKIVKKEF